MRAHARRCISCSVLYACCLRDGFNSGEASQDMRGSPVLTTWSGSGRHNSPLPSLHPARPTFGSLPPAPAPSPGSEMARAGVHCWPSLATALQALSSHSSHTEKRRACRCTSSKASDMANACSSCFSSISSCRWHGQRAAWGAFGKTLWNRTMECTSRCAASNYAQNTMWTAFWEHSVVEARSWMECS